MTKRLGTKSLLVHRSKGDRGSAQPNHWALASIDTNFNGADAFLQGEGQVFLGTMPWSRSTKLVPIVGCGILVFVFTPTTEGALFADVPARTWDSRGPGYG